MSYLYSIYSGGVAIISSRTMRAIEAQKMEIVADWSWSVPDDKDIAMNDGQVSKYIVYLLILSPFILGFNLGYRDVWQLEYQECERRQTSWFITRQNKNRTDWTTGRYQMWLRCGSCTLNDFFKDSWYHQRWEIISSCVFLSTTDIKTSKIWCRRGASVFLSHLFSLSRLIQVFPSLPVFLYFPCVQRSV